MKDWRDGYICSADETPDIRKPVWLRVNATRPRKCYFNGYFFDYVNKELSKMYCSVGENVYWKYCKVK